MKKMSLFKKIILICLLLTATCFIVYGLYYLFHYKLYDKYKESKLTYDVETGKEFNELKDSNPKVEGMVLAAENELLKLYTNTKTAEIAIYDKRNETITYSNPPAVEEDTLASPINKSLMKSQLCVEFVNTARTISTYNSYDYAVEFDQVQIEAIENGIRYTYTLGDLSSPTGIVPVYISKDRLDQYTAMMPEEEAKFVKMRYEDSDEASGKLELLEVAKTGASTLRKIGKYLEAVGYTEDDYEADMLDSGVEGALSMSFVIALEYRLDEDSLVVNLPTSLIEENGGSKITNIEVLRFFGAAGSQENGYMLVPNASGSLINFNNGKTNVQDYAQYIYGIDPLLSENTIVEKSLTARLPVFGIQRKDSGIFVSIENGESLALLTASIAGKLNSYNYVYASYALRNTSRLSMFGSTGNEADLPVVEEKIYDINVQVRYSFLTKEYEGYSGMANYYRERLIKMGVLEKDESSDSIPLYMDIIGGVKRIDYFLGAQYWEVYPMTTFDEAGEIADAFYDASINHLIMNYQGWFNGGYYHNIADRIRGVGKIGGKADLEALNDTLELNGGKLYADVAFQKVSYVSTHFNYLNETARYYAGGRIASFGQVNPASLTNMSAMFYMETLYDLLSPKFLVRYVDKFADKITDYDVTGISLRDLGETLYSDKKRTEFIDREFAKQVVIDQFEILDKTGMQLMVNDGNFYSLSFTDDLLNIPTSANTYFSVDEEVPFYEMVVHGSISYCGSAINLGDSFDYDDIVLRLIEYGAAPHFTFTYENSSELKYTGLNRNYSTNYMAWKDDAIRVYNETNQVLKYVTDSVIVKHESIDTGVKRITYDNGVIITINTTDVPVTVDDVTLDAKSYEVKGVEQ